MRSAWAIFYYFFALIIASSAQVLSLQGDDGQDRWGDHLRLEQGKIRSNDDSPVVYPFMNKSYSDVRMISKKGHIYFNEHGDRAGELVDSVRDQTSAHSISSTDDNFRLDTNDSNITPPVNQMFPVLGWVWLIMGVVIYFGARYFKNETLVDDGRFYRVFRECRRLGRKRL